MQPEEKLFDRFCRLVRDDPELVKLAARARESDPGFDLWYASPINRGDPKHLRPLEYIDRAALAAQLASLPPPYRPEPPTTFAVELAAFNRLDDLWDGFLRPLRSGEVLARGIPVAAGDSPEIDRAVWSHPDFFFDCDTGDVYFALPNDLKYRPRVRWVAVRVVPVVATTVIAPAVSGDQITAANVVPMKRDQKTPAGRSAKRRGGPPVKFNRARETMLADLANRKFTRDALKNLLEKQLVREYGHIAQRTVLRDARIAALSEFKSRQIATNDK